MEHGWHPQCSARKKPFARSSTSLKRPSSIPTGGSTLNIFSINAIRSIYYGDPMSIPEPSTYARLLGGTVLGYAFWRRRK